MLLILDAVKMEGPDESDESSKESKECEIYHWDAGLPYGPEDFPKRGDKWGWSVGKRVGVSGNFLDRFLHLPHRLHNKSWVGSTRFDNKPSIERFLLEEFPGTDINAFFASFTWNIPAAKIKGCKAGNMNCSSLLETNDPDRSNTITCDICCIEPHFCYDCCCILCSKPVNSSNNDGQSFIKCETMVKDGFKCGHACHIECGLRSYMAGTVGGTIGLDAEYYCRRCDSKTDLIPLVENILGRCDSIRYGDTFQKILDLCVGILQGSTKESAKILLSDVAKLQLKEGNTREDIWKSTVTIV